MTAAAGQGPGPVRALDDAQIEQFVRDGAVKLAGAVPPELAERCRALLWLATGCDEHDPSTWTRPVIRIPFRDDPPFAAAASTPRLHAAFDQLAGRGRWVPRTGLGTFPIRFPTAVAPDDVGWHIEATGFDEAGRPRVELASRERVLLLLFLFSDVGPDDAATLVRAGSHRPAAALLAAAGPGGADVADISARLESTRGLPEIAATGRAGDVWLCHPFVLHSAQAHRGRRPKFMAQPPLAGTTGIDPQRPVQDRSPVERAVADAVVDRSRPD